MFKTKRQEGFTIIEVFIVIAIIGIIIFWGFIGCTIVKGNFWLTEDGVLKDLQINYPEVSEILRVNRNIFSYSEIYVENEDGSRGTYELDTCVLFNYEFPDYYEDK